MQVALRALFFLLLINSALAQNVTQSGTVTPGHAVKWAANGVVSDGGTAASGSFTSLGVTNGSQPGICVNSGPITGPYNAFCLSATQTGGGILSLFNYNGATGSFSINLNGVAQGLVTATLPVIKNDVACFADTLGTIGECSLGAPWQVANHAIALGKGAGSTLGTLGPGTLKGQPVISGDTSTDPIISSTVIDASQYVVADGSTDNSAGLNAAITNAQALVTSSGGFPFGTPRVVLPYGIIRITSLVSVTGPICISGQGIGNTVLLLDSASDIFQFNPNSQYNQACLEKLTIKAGRAAAGRPLIYNGVVAGSANNPQFTMRDVLIRGEYFTTGMLINNCWECYFDRIEILGDSTTPANWLVSAFEIGNLVINPHIRSVSIYGAQNCWNVTGAHVEGISLESITCVGALYGIVGAPSIGSPQLTISGQSHFSIVSGVFNLTGGSWAQLNIAGGDYYMVSQSGFTTPANAVALNFAGVGGVILHANTISNLNGSPNSTVGVKYDTGTTYVNHSGNLISGFNTCVSVASGVTGVYGSDYFGTCTIATLSNGAPATFVSTNTIFRMSGVANTTFYSMLDTTNNLTTYFNYNNGALTVVRNDSATTSMAWDYGSSIYILGASGVLGTLKFGNATNGLLAVHAATGALGTSDWTIPVAASETFVGLALTQELTNKTLTSAVAKGTWTASGTWTIPAVTLGGTVSGGGNQINNVIIGTSTPLAGSFTTVAASTSVTSPLHIGGSGTTGTQLTLQTTTGNGTTDAFAFKGGNNGGTTFATMTSSLLTLNGNLNLPNAGLIYPASDSTTALKITKANATTAVITVDTTNSGVGIGVTPTAGDGSSVQFQLGDRFRFQNVVGTQGFIGRNAYFNGANWKYIVTGEASGIRMYDGNGSFAMYTAASGTAGNNITGFDDGSANRLFVDVTGFVVVNGTFAATTTATGALRIPNGGAGISGAVYAGGDIVSTGGNITVTTAAKTLVLKQGANGAVGTFVCNGVTPVTVNNTNIAITDGIGVSLNTVGGTVGAVPAVKTITASSGFTIACTASDTSTYNYWIIKNAA